jgi:hypothetical protein
MEQKSSIQCEIENPTYCKSGMPIIDNRKKDENCSVGSRIKELENMLTILTNGIQSPENNESFKMLLFINNLNILMSVGVPILINTNDNIPPELKDRLLRHVGIVLDNFDGLLKLIEPKKENSVDNIFASTLPGILLNLCKEPNKK